MSQFSVIVSYIMRKLQIIEEFDGYVWEIYDHNRDNYLVNGTPIPCFSTIPHNPSNPPLTPSPLTTTNFPYYSTYITDFLNTPFILHKLFTQLKTPINMDTKNMLPLFMTLLHLKQHVIFYLGINPTSVIPNFDVLNIYYNTHNMVDSLIAHLKLVIIIKAVNQIANNDNE